MNKSMHLRYARRLFLTGAEDPHVASVPRTQRRISRFGWSAVALSAVAGLLTAIALGRVQVAKIEQATVAAQTSEDLPTLPSAPDALGNPSGLSAAPGNSAGGIELTWTPAANSDLHLVYLVAADGSGGRYSQRLPVQSSGVTILDLVGGWRCFFIMIAGQAAPVGSGSYHWSAWTNWTAETATQLGALPEPPAWPRREEREYSRYADSQGLLSPHRTII